MSEHSRQVLRRVYRDAALEKIPMRAQVGEAVVILDRRERRKIARDLAKRKTVAEREAEQHDDQRP